MGTFWYEWFRLFFNKRKKYIDKKDQLKTIGIFVQEPNEAFIKKYYLSIIVSSLFLHYYFRLGRVRRKPLIPVCTLHI